MKFSILISTHPSRHISLSYCLKSLLNQSYNNFEVIVINDGKDNDTLKVVNSYSSFFSLNYYTRKNDHCISKSRNIASNKAKNEYLIFLDSDIILNKKALLNYKNIFENNFAISSIWGVYGYCKKKRLIKDISELVELRNIFKEQKLLDFINKSQFGTNLIPLKPYFYAWSANFSIKKNAFERVNGFNEKFINWGGEDLEFAYRLYKKKLSFYFTKETWGEHIRLEKYSPFYNSKKDYLLKKLKPIFKSDLDFYYNKNNQELILNEFNSLLKKIPNNDFLVNKFNEYKKVQNII